MGAINQAFNQAAGVVAGAALAYQHAKESDFAKMNSADSNALVARNQSRAATAEANDAYYEATKEGGLIDQVSEAEVKAEEAEKAYNKAAGRKNASKKTVTKKMTELVAAQRAAKELNDKYKALTDIQDRAIEQRRYAAKATQMALDEKTKYEKRWGGTK